MRLLALLVFLAACSQPTPPETLERKPVLSEEPVWQVIDPSPDPLNCFGAAVAVGDLDGDDEVDLIVGDPPCLFSPPTAGRIAIYRGTSGAFEDVPVWTELAWTNPPRGGTQMTLATDDIDGDGIDDLVVGARAGVQVFAGIADLTVPLAPPSYRLPGTGNFGAMAVADFDGDGRIEIASVRAGAATVWRQQGGGIAAVRAFAPATTIVSGGDEDGDGDAELIVTTFGGSDVYRGCAPLDADCDGGLGIAPAWSVVDRAVIALVPDLNQDGHAEALLSDPPQATGRLWLHLSEPGGIAAAATWSTLADPNYPVLGRPVLVPGDLDGDRKATELVIASAGRVYAMFPERHDVGELEPGFAWPRADTIQAQLLAGEPTYGNTPAVLAAGLIDRDKYVDLVIAVPPELGDPRPGQVLVFAGGKRPKHQPAPYLPGEQVCSLPAGDLPDLWVDPASLARSLHVEYREFAPDACELVEQCVGGPGERKLLKFATSIANLGGGPAIIPGPEDAPQLYYFDECHGHEHLEDFARYELVDANGTTIAVGRKQGFFLVDIAPYCSDGPARGDYFPHQGISPGWSDVYVASLPCQWLDVTGIPDGIYTLEVEADTRGLIAQQDVLPDVAAVRVKLEADRVTVLP